MLRHSPSPEPGYSLAGVLRRLAALLVAAIVLAAGIAAQADEIRLKREVASAGPSVKLREVAELQGRQAESLADTVVLLFSEGQGEGRVTLENLRAVLDDAGANWGVLSLRGFTSCRVHRKLGGFAASSVEPDSPDVAAMPVPSADRENALSNLEQAIDVDAAVSLRAVVLDRLAQMAATAPQDLRVSFAERDAAALSRSALVDRYEIETTARNTLGRIPLTIRRYRGDELAETLHVTADVSRRSLAVVATATVTRGSSFTRDAIEVREVWLTDSRETPVADPRLVIGQTAKVLLRPGTLVLPEHLAQPVLIRKGELITVRCLAGSLVVRTVARASEEGGMGDLIQVRNEATRETFTATITGPREAVMNLTPAAPTANLASGADQ